MDANSTPQVGFTKRERKMAQMKLFLVILQHAQDMTLMASHRRLRKDGLVRASVTNESQHPYPTTPPHVVQRTISIHMKIRIVTLEQSNATVCPSPYYLFYLSAWLWVPAVCPFFALLPGSFSAAAPQMTSVYLCPSSRCQPARTESYEHSQ